MFLMEFNKFSNISNFPALMALNFALTTDPTGFRASLWNHYCGDEIKRFDWLLCLKKEKMGIDSNNPEKMVTHFETLRRSPFWLSPRGNGWDCHRTWEPLRLGRVPIISVRLKPLFHGLPVVFVEDSDMMNLNRIFLESEFYRIYSDLLRNEFSHFEKMTMRHRKSAIYKAANLEGKFVDSRPRCWGPGLKDSVQ